MGRNDLVRAQVHPRSLVGRDHAWPGDLHRLAGLQPAGRRPARRSRSEAGQPVTDLLRVEDLWVRFPKRGGGMIEAVRGKEWAEAARHAELLNEAGHVLMADGRCPDKVWADAATQLRDGSDAVLAALNAKNATGAQSAFNDTLVKACASCHAVHKPK